MTKVEKKKRRPRGLSARGNFDRAKENATVSENDRLEATKRKSEALRQARLQAQASSYPRHPS
jgi:hypothetical protein